MGIVDIRMDEHNQWQLPASELDKLLDPAVKVFCLVNPSNSPSTKLRVAGQSDGERIRVDRQVHPQGAG